MCFFFSFDTEALHKMTLEGFYENLEEDKFINKFSNSSNTKIKYGTQLLYTIGLVDMIPFDVILNIFQKYFPLILVKKIKKYVNMPSDALRTHISWTYFKSKIDNIPKEKLQICAEELIFSLEKQECREQNVKTFHIGDNDNYRKSTEPTFEKTCQMIYRFLTYIYQRNILSTLIKYVLLHPLITKFETSILSEQKKGMFGIMKRKLNEIIFETILTAFNGSNYDNFLITNYLVIIQTRLGEKISIFKKGASISTIIVTINKNLNRLGNITKTTTIKTNKQIKGDDKWLMKLYIKDVRNLVASNLSLDKLGRLFNLNVSKLVFPYNRATSIKKLKEIESLYPNDDSFWKDNFSSKSISLDDRINAQELFERMHCKNLYQYSIFYLIQDCILLHSIVLTLFKTYLEESINIFIRRNFSQSSLAFQQFFVVEPSRQILKNNAPKKINHSFYNYFLKTAVTGGICTCFVHGTMDNNVVLNEHFNYVDRNLDKNKWPNFANLPPGKIFNNTLSTISTIDIRSLYPSAALKRLAIGTPVFYSRFIPDDFEKIGDKTLQTYNLNGFCQNVRESGNPGNDFFKLISSRPRFYTELNALEYHLRNLPSNIKIIRFQSAFTAFGQLWFSLYPLDGFLSFLDENNQLNIHFIQYNSVYCHGHKETCNVKNDSINQEKFNKTIDVKNNIITLINHFKEHFELQNTKMEYIEISDCDFFMHKIPCFHSFQYKKMYTYTSFLHNIYNNNLTGLLVVKNLEIKCQNPIFGFIIQKVQYDITRLSPYTQNLLSHFSGSKKVISLNKCKSFMIISTEYFNWLHKTFGFKETPDIYHALLFQTDYYVKPYIEKKLSYRKTLKELIKNEKDTTIRQNYEIKAELIKLLLNSCYGFTLCNTNSSKFKVFQNRKSLPKNNGKINYCIELCPKVYLVELNKKIEEPYQNMLGQIGCYILFHSKIILLKRLYFLLKHLNPTMAQLCYMDTDSAHIGLKYPNFIDNVDENLKQSFKNNYDKHFESGSKLSGIWVLENQYESANYIGEKAYVLGKNNSNCTSHIKGLNSFFQKQYVENNIDKINYPTINYNTFQKSSDFVIYKTYMSKNIFSNYVPTKRYFVCANLSLPLKFS